MDDFDAVIQEAIGGDDDFDAVIAEAAGPIGKPEVDRVRTIMSQLARAGLNVAGLPADLVRIMYQGGGDLLRNEIPWAFDNPEQRTQPPEWMGGSQAMIGALSDATGGYIWPQPQSLPEQIGDEILTSGMTLGGLLGSAGRMSQMDVARAGPMMQAVAQHPRAMFFGEGAAQAGSTGAGLTAREMGAGPDTENVARLAGGQLPTAAVAAAGKLPGRATVGQMRDSVRTMFGGAENVVLDQILKAAGPGVDKNALAAAIRTGNKEAISTSGRVPADEFLQRLAGATAREYPNEFNQELVGYRNRAAADIGKVAGGGDPLQPSQFFRGKYKETQQNLQRRLTAAEERAAKAIEKLEPGKSPEAIGRRFDKTRLEIEKKASDAVAKAYEKIPEETPTPLNAAKAELETVLGMQKASDPELHSKFTSALAGENALPDMTTFGEVKSLRTNIRSRLEQIKRHSGNQYLIRAYSKLASALTEDMGNARASGKAIKEAEALNKWFIETFREGAVGDIAGKGVFRKGAAPEGTGLQEGITARGGPATAADVDAMLAVGRETPTSPIARAVRESLDDWTRLKVADDAVDGLTGKLNPRSAARFMRRNSDLLERFPHIRDILSKGAKERARADTVGKRLVRMEEALRNTAANKYLGRAWNQKIEQAISSPERFQELDALYKTAQRDPTGRTTAGLRAKTVDEVLQAAHQDAALQGGEVTALRLNNSMRKFEDALRYLAPDEQARVKFVQKQLTHEEMFRTRKESLEDVTGAAPDYIYGNLLRIGGAGASTLLGYGELGAGPSLQAAQITSAAFKRIGQRLPWGKQREIYKRFILDPEFAAQLLERPTSMRDYRAKMVRINAYLANLIEEE